jgi:hypothetical protein
MIARPAVAVISAAILAYEVLLVRLFAIVQWHHFAFMAISVALLGFGISGACLAVLRSRVIGREARVFTWNAMLFAVSAPTAFLVSQSVPFNALAVVWAPSQLLYLGVIYIVLAVPFATGASCIGLAFLQIGASPGRVYLWNLVGSGAGAAGVIGALHVFAPITCLAIVGLMGVLAAATGETARGNIRRAVMLLGASALGILVVAQAPAIPISLRISEFKGLVRALATRDARLEREYSSPLALISIVESPAVPFRYAPGLSLVSPALPPPQLGVFVDGEFAAAIDQWDGRIESLRYLDYSTDALVYHLAREPDVLVGGAGGGRLVLQALGHEAARIDAVELNPDMHRAVATDFSQRAGPVYDRPEVTAHVEDFRRFVMATSSTWDIITISALDGGMAAARGLNEDYLHTVEAYARIYGRLADAGWLSVTVRLDLPPRAALKIAATIRAALGQMGIDDPAERLIAIRGLTTVTLIVKRGHVTPEDIARTKTFAEARGFDLVHYPGMMATEANRLNVLAEPSYYNALRALLGAGHENFVARYKFDIAPATDDRPYFHDFFRWATLSELAGRNAGESAALLDLGGLILVATLVQSLVLGLLLILLPLWARPYRRKERAIAWRFGGYFGAIGVAFLFVEIAWIQKFVLFLGHPIYAVSVALSGFLVFAGLGAGVSARLDHALASARIGAIEVAVAAIAGLSIVYLAILPPMFVHLAGLADAPRIALALALIAPVAFFMGMPFPIGLDRVVRADPDFVPWAWGLNGCASVVSVSGATLLATHFGFSATIVTAIGIYLAGALLLRDHASG